MTGLDTGMLATAGVLGYPVASAFTMGALTRNNHDDWDWDNPVKLFLSVFWPLCIPVGIFWFPVKWGFFLGRKTHKRKD